MKIGSICHREIVNNENGHEHEHETEMMEVEGVCVHTSDCFFH